MRRKLQYPPEAFHPLREQLVDQTLAQCRCGVFLRWSPPESLTYLLLHPCLVVLPVTYLRALRMAAKVRPQLPGTTIRVETFTEAGETFALLANPHAFGDHADTLVGDAQELVAHWRENSPDEFWYVFAPERVTFRLEPWFGSITLARDSATVAM